MSAHELRGRVLTADGWREGSIRFDGRVLEIESVTLAPDEQRRRIVPGFIDLHVHGAAGVDIMEGGDSALTVGRVHARHGTTALLGTTMTAPEAEISLALQGLGHAIAEPGTRGGARILGVHLEGPFISDQNLGAQPPAVLRATRELIERFSALAPIRVLTIAPEIPGHLELVPAMAAMGIRVQLGHSAGSYEEGLAALQAGATGFTHLFNAMSAFDHRQPGIAAVALAHAEYAELIPDLVHVHPGAIRAALRAIPKLYCVTDATAATDMPDGEYPLGSQRVHKCLGCVRLASGSLAGSALTMDQALRNLASLGMDVADASQRLSAYPADYLGIADRGRLRPGAWADIVVLDDELQVQQVFVEGEAIALG